MTLDDIITERMQSPFTRAGLAQAVYSAQPELGIKKAAMIANNAIEKAVREGLISFTKDAGMAVFRRIA